MPPYFEQLSTSLYLAIGSLTDISLGRKTHFQQVLNLLFQEDEKNNFTYMDLCNHKIIY